MTLAQIRVLAFEVSEATRMAESAVKLGIPAEEYSRKAAELSAKLLKALDEYRP